jgi:hypothetical protein
MGRDDAFRVGPGSSITPPTLMVLSPELALVDPELREAALASLPLTAAPDSRPAKTVPVVDAPPRLSRLLAAALLAVLAAAGALATGSSAHRRDAAQPVRALGSEAPAPTALRRWVWPRVPRAALYRVSFLQDGRAMFVSWPAQPPLVLSPGIRFGVGSYVWQVRPVFWRHGRAAVGAPIVRSRFVVPR